MSDALPTPPLPQSPVSNDAFEALIDLLASDGIDDTAPHDGVQSSVKLRDSSGRLDFDKIRNMFAIQNQSQVVEPTDRVHLSARSEITGENDNDAPHASSSKSILGHPNSKYGDKQSPSNFVEGALQQTGSHPSHPSILRTPLCFEEMDTALSHAHAEVASLRQKYDELQALVSKRFRMTGRHSSSDKPRDRKHPNNADNSDLQPASPVQLSNLSSTPPVITESRDRDTEFDPERSPPVHHQDHAECPRRPELSSSPNLLPDVNCLSEDEAKHALTTILRALNIAPCSIAHRETFVSSHSHEKEAPKHTLDEVVIAVKFLTVVDELVWRRSLTEARTGQSSTSSSGECLLAPTSSEDNISALLARLQLWERAIRGANHP